MRIRWNYNRPGWFALGVIKEARLALLDGNWSWAAIDKLNRIAQYVIESNDDNSIEFVD